MASLAFERLLIALESVRGTPINPPTHYMNVAGSITPAQDKYRPEESRGYLAEHSRSKTVRRWSEFEGEGPLDGFTLPVWLEMHLRGGVTPTTPSGGTTARLWTYLPDQTSDTVKSATGYWGDPNTQEFQAPYLTTDDLTISGDASGTDGAMISISGQGQFPAKTAPSSTPAQLTAPLFAPADMQLWLDTASAIGTTAITGRFISGELSISSAISRKWLARGPGGGLSFSRIGRGKRHAELKLVFEFLDTAQYDLYADSDGDTTVKARWRLNGPLIETGLYHYVEADVYGPMDALAWGENESTNRTLELTIMSEYQAAVASDFVVRVQNTRTTL